MIRFLPEHSTILLFGFALTALSPGGCRSFLTERTGPQPLSDRLVRAYPELSDGRFAVIADFEDPRQTDLFHAEGASEATWFDANSRRGRRETGGTCLEFTSSSSGDALILRNSESARWYLKRDWREFDLLRLSVHAPPPPRGGRQQAMLLHITVSASAVELARATSASFPLQPGWNDLQLDLAELGEKIPLDSIQEIRLAMEGPGETRTYRLDDIILAGHRRVIAGNPETADGSLYVRKIGRRLHVGSGGRFELVFGNAQMIGWYDLESDPYRLRNLMHVASAESIPSVEGNSRVSSTVVRMELMEANQVRAIIHCERSDSMAEKAGANRASSWEQTVYTIYPTGQLFIAVSSLHRRSSSQSEDNPPRNRYSIELAGTEWREFSRWAPVETTRAPMNKLQLAHVTHPPTGCAILFMVARNSGSHLSIREEPAGITNIRTEFADETGGRDYWFAQCLLSGKGGPLPDVASARVASFQSPPPLELDTGRIVTGHSTSTDAGGFDFESGVYRVSPEKDRIRLQIGGRRSVIFSPAFCVEGSEHQDAWVYVNDRLHQPVARDREGRLIFQLSESIRDRTAVEVLLRSRSDTDAAP